jgi:ribA/ribD-fused uncharacterized protein
MQVIKFMSRIPEYAWLSNFELGPVTDLQGTVWRSAEHCYQAAKTQDKAEKQKIWAARDARTAKRLGSNITCRDNWEHIKLEVMRRILVAKFSQNPEFYTLLLNCDGVELIHEAPWDDYWGTGRNGRGLNMQGKLLMDLRDAWLKEEPARAVSIKEEPNAEYIGRGGHGQDGYFGNPYPVGSVCKRCGVRHMNGGSTLACYAGYFWERIRSDADFKESVLLLKGRPLGCFCKTREGVGNPCHGDILSLWLNNYGGEQ